MRDLRTGIGISAHGARVVDVELRTFRDRHFAAGRAAVRAEGVRSCVESEHDLLSVGDHDLLVAEVRAVERDRARAAERDRVAACERAVAIW